MAVSAAMFLVSVEAFAQTYTYPTADSGVATTSTSITSTSTSVSNTAPTPLAESTLNVSVEDLKAVGFTNPVVKSPTVSAFLAPVQYFTVKETVNMHPEWGSAGNLVAAFAQKIADPAWLYNNGQMEIVDISGRTQARVSRPGYYIVVTGPDANKTVALANLIKNRK